MLLKNLMEEKQQLNYDQPLLSVRRFSPMVASEKDNARKTDKSLPGIPRLPLYKTELKSGPVTNPGMVPFLWEQRPGRPKEEMKPHNENSDRPPIAPKLPPGKSSIVSKSQSRNGEAVNNFERCNKTIEKESCHSGDSHDEAYADVLDTFSSTESIFFNCSTSGLSSLDELEVKPFGPFSTDPLTRDFMMDRFLPAAKAMASETPLFATKKQTIVQEKPREIKKIVNPDKPSLQHGPSLVKRYLQFQENEEEEEESDDDYDQRRNFPAVCGLLPWFCLNHSFCLIHPVTATSMRTQLPKSSVNKLHDRSSAASSYSKRDHESRSNFSDRNYVGDQISLRTDFNSNSRQRQNPDGSLLHRQLQEQSTSKFFDESPNKKKGVINFPEETKNQGINGFGSHKKGHKTFRDFLSEDSSEESCAGIPLVEKTLYPDAVQKVKSPSREPFSANMQGSKERPSSSEKEYKVVTETMNQCPLVDCSLKDTDKLETVDGANLLPHSQKYDNVVESSTSVPNQKSGREASKDSITAPNDEVTDKKATENLQKQPSKTENRENIHHSGGLQYPFPPPSPISPSESWLQQTVPSMSAKNSHKRSHLRAAENPQKQVSKVLPGDLKWLTLVKTTKAG